MRESNTSVFVFAAKDGGLLQRFKARNYKAVHAVGLAGGSRVNIHCLCHTWATRF